MERHSETRRLKLALAISLGYFFAELIAGFLTNSLALLSDAGHMLSDIGAIVVSLFAFLILASLIAAGFFGSRDPLSNPLPLVVWTLLWVGLTLVQEVLSAHGFNYALERTGHGTTQFSIVMEGARAGSADSSDSRVPRAFTGG